MVKLKKIIIAIIIILTFSFFAGSFLLSTTNQNLISFKRLFPPFIKDFLKQSLFILPSLKKDLKELKAENTRLENVIYGLEEDYDIANERIFPETQFLKLKFDEYKIKIKSKYEYTRYGIKVEPFYIDIYNDRLIIGLKDGKLILANLNNLENLVEYEILNSDLKKNIEITDILVIKDHIYVLFSEKDKNGCNTGNLNLYSADLNFNFLNFKKRLSIKNSKYKETDPLDCQNVGVRYGVSAGKMQNLLDGSILFSSSKYDVNNLEDDKFINNSGLLTNKFSVFLKFNPQDNSYKVYSAGHRNPIGVTQDLNTGVILATEHGPRGGDEINKIIEGENYGWPIVSYGEPYSTKLHDKYYYKKNHSTYKFQEPIYSFVPSIGISEIIKIGDNFSDKWKNNFLVGSLKKRSLFRIEFDKNFTKVKFIENIFVGRRIRDMIYDEKNSKIYLAMEDQGASLGVLYVD